MEGKACLRPASARRCICGSARTAVPLVQVGSTSTSTHRQGRSMPRSPWPVPKRCAAPSRRPMRRFEGWRRTPPPERRRTLSRLADLIEEHGSQFGQLGAFDNGTPVTAVDGLTAISVEWTRYYAGFADKLSGDVTSSYAADATFSYTLPEPYGVIGIIITWNGPLISLAMKIPAALAAGYTVVVKPSELTPFSAELFMDLVIEAGVPAGRVNILPGDRSRPARRWSPTPSVPKGELHRGSGHREHDPPRLCRTDEARHARARREVGQHHLRGRRPRQRMWPGHDDVRRRAERPGLRLPDQDARPPPHLRRGSLGVPRLSPTASRRRPVGP